MCVCICVCVCVYVCVCVCLRVCFSCLLFYSKVKESVEERYFAYAALVRLKPKISYILKAKIFEAR